MAQGDNVQITSDTTNGQRVQNSLQFKGSKPQTEPTFQQLLQSDGSKWSHIASQITKKNNQQEDDVNRHNKKSVLTKVKETAKKLKISLRRKKHGEKNDIGPKDKGEEDSKYQRARTYESNKNTPPTNKQASVSGNHLEIKLNTNQTKDEHASFSNNKIHAPSDPSADYTKHQTASTMDVPKVHEFPQRNSKFSDLKVSTSSRSSDNISEDRSFKRESQTPDKAVTVKEYLMHKFEPGEDECTLSKIITQAISPRRDKMREAMSSFLKNEDQSCQVNSSSVDNNNVNINFKSKSLPAASTSTGSNIAPIKQIYSLGGSNASKATASMNLNQTFKSTFASYQDHFLSSNSSHSPKSNQSLNLHNLPNTKTSSSSRLDHASGSNETQAPHVSSVKKTRVPSHSVRRVPVSRAKHTQVPSHVNESNTVRARSSTRTDSNPLCVGDQGGRFQV